MLKTNNYKCHKEKKKKIQKPVNALLAELVVIIMSMNKKQNPKLHVFLVSEFNYYS